MLMVFKIGIDDYPHKTWIPLSIAHKDMLLHRDSIGNEPDGPFDGQISNVYLIDGQQLGPEYFGFTDPLTNTWKPKKYTGTFTQSS